MTKTTKTLTLKTGEKQKQKKPTIASLAKMVGNLAQAVNVLQQSVQENNTSIQRTQAEISKAQLSFQNPPPAANLVDQNVYLTSVETPPQPEIQMQQSGTQMQQPTTQVQQPLTQMQQPLTQMQQPMTQMQQPITRMQQPAFVPQDRPNFLQFPPTNNPNYSSAAGFSNVPYITQYQSTPQMFNPQSFGGGQGYRDEFGRLQRFSPYQQISSQPPMQTQPQNAGVYSVSNHPFPPRPAGCGGLTKKGTKCAITSDKSIDKAIRLPLLCGFNACYHHLAPFDKSKFLSKCTIAQQTQYRRR